MMASILQQCQPRKSETQKQEKDNTVKATRQQRQSNNASGKEAMVKRGEWQCGSNG